MKQEFAINGISTINMHFVKVKKIKKDNKLFLGEIR
jgi:hypothetical protein